MLSLLPVPSRPHTITELSGIAGSGIVTLPKPGTIVALMSKVKTPDDETLNWSTKLLLKVNGKEYYLKLTTLEKYCQQAIELSMMYLTLIQKDIHCPYSIHRGFRWMNLECKNTVHE
jgi:hypothetical protein